jgi:cytochrome bd-type quinol oxidase subunit 2
VGVGQTQDPPFSQACPPAIPDLVVTVQALGLGIVVIGAIGLFVWQLGSLDRGSESAGRGSLMRLAPLLATAAGTLIGLLIVPFLPQTPLISTSGLPVEPLALIGSMPLVLLAAFIVTARDARRFVVGFLTAATGWFLVFYPNISALPLPSVVANAYQGVLPTYLYLFQFPSNRTEVARDVSLLDPVAFLIAAGLTLLCVVLAYSAWLWRIALAERAAEASLPPDSPDQPGRPDLPPASAGG